MKQLKNQFDKNGKAHGYWEYHEHYGLMISCGNYNHGLKDREWKMFWQSGVIREIITYNNGNAIDLYQNFDVKGNITNEIIFIQ